MKLHLPVKLRASVIAAILAVPAMLYNAFAANYVAPSNDYRWDNNDIELEETYLATSGNTYTADAQTYDVYETYANFANVRVGYIVNPAYTGSTPVFPTDYIALDYNGEVYSYTNAAGETVIVPMMIKQADDTLVPNSALKYNITSAGVVDDANIIISNTENDGSGKIVSYINGHTTLTAADDIQINNSLLSGNETQEGPHPYEGDLNLKADNLIINKDSQNQGSTVVLEDANVDITTSTVIGESSRLVILDGAATYTDTEKKLLGIDGIAPNEVDRTEENTVNLGAVSGKGSLAVVGSKVDGVAGDNLDLSIDSIELASGTVGLADADADVTGDIKAKTLTLVDSVSTAGGKVTIAGLNVDADSSLTAQGTVSNAAGGGSGHVDVKGYVESVTGSVEFSNGMEEKNYGVKEGATVKAKQNIVLSNVDVNKAAELTTTDGDLRLTTHSSIEDSHKIHVGDNLSVAVGSVITDSTIDYVGGDVIITDYSGGESSAASSISDSVITIKPDALVNGGASEVTIEGGSSMTNTHITGGDGNITVDDSTITVQGKDAVTDADGNEITPAYEPTTNFIGAEKEGLGKILTAAQGTTPLTSDSLKDSFTVGSSIENTAGAVTITDSKVNASLITGGGDITIDDQVDTPDSTAAITAVKELIDDALANPVVNPATGESAVVVPYTEINGEFGTVVDGSILDVRGAEDADGNDLTVSQAALTNSVVLGVTGKIKIEDSVLGNDYIDGGSGFEIDNSVIIDTDIVNMTADIVLKDDTSFISTDPDKKFVLTTQGTYEEKDYDEYTGGSIILDGASVTNGTIKSGVKAIPSYDANGDITGWDYVAASPADPALNAKYWNGSAYVDITDSKLPYGQIKATDSSLTNMEISTAAGDISVDASTVYDSDISSASVGNISITNKSEVDNTSVSAAGAGNITIADSTITDSVLYEEDADGNATAHSQSISTGGAGNIAITNSTVTDTDVTTGGAGTITITDSTVAVAGPALLPGTTPVARKEVSTGGAGKIEISGSSVAHIDVANSTAIAEADKATQGNGTITVTDSTVADSSILTGTGDIAVTDSAVSDSSITSIGAGKVTLTATAATSTQPTDAGWVSSNTVADSAISTGAGNITITATKVTDSTVTNAGDGNITISNSAILGSETTDGSFTTQVSTKGNGFIKVTDSITDKASVTTGAGNISLVGTLPISSKAVATDGSYIQNPTQNTSGSYSKVNISKLTSIGVPRDAKSLSSITVELRNAAQPSVIAILKDKDGNTVATSKPIVIVDNPAGTWDTGTFNFATDAAIDPNAGYTLEFVDAADGTTPTKLAMNHEWTADDIAASTSDATFGYANVVLTAEYKTPIYDVDDAPVGSILSNVVADSLIQSEGDGNITITRTDMDNSTVLTGSGDTTITASDIRMSDIDSADAGKITIKGSYVEDSTVTSGEGTNLATITIADSDIIRTGVKAAAAGVNNTITNSYVEDSVVYSGGGNMTISTSEVLGSDVETADGGMFVRGESTIDSLGADTTYDKSTLTATDDSKVLEGSYVSGTNISITDTDNDGVAPDLTVEGTTADGLTPTTIAGDVNMEVGGMVYISTNGKLALDGNRAENPEERDASITATSMLLGDIWNSEASIANAQVAITDKTLVRDGNTLNLDSVNSLETEGVGTLGDLLQGKDDRGETLVEIDGASNLQVDSIGTVGGFSETLNGSAMVDDNASKRADQAAYYLDQIKVDEDSKLTATGTVMIDTLDVNKEYNDHSIAATDGSHVTMQKDAHIINANLAGQGVRDYDGLSTPSEGSFNIGATIYGDAHIGNLNLNDEAVLNLVKKESSVADPVGKHYIANLNTADIKGTINLIGGELTTPELLAEGLDLGLNGGTVILEAVTDAKLGATKTSAAAANAAVVLRSVTNASMVGGMDKTPCGPSTIKTTVNRVESVASINPGTETKTTATTYYYKVMSDTEATAKTTVQRWNSTTLALETVTVNVGDTLKSGDIITKTDKVYTTTTASDGSVVNTGIATSNAHELSAAEESYLVRITVPVLDENGEPTFTEIAAGDFVLNVGQTVTQEELTYQDGYAEIDGSVVEMKDGIASLTVAEGFDADNTTIKAYETGSYKYMLEGVELTQAEYDALTDEEKATVHMQVVVDADTGFIAIGGALTGQDNTFYADNDITIKGGIVADGDASYENKNTLTSARGDIEVNGITGSANELTATTGDILIGSTAADGTVTAADINGNANVLTAGGNITVANINGKDNTLTADDSITADDIVGDDNTLEADGSITVDNIDGSGNILDAGDALITGTITGDKNDLAGKTIETESIAGDYNVLQSDESTKVDGTLAGDDNTIVAGTTVEITGGIVADADDASSDGNFILANDGDITIDATDGKSLVGSENVLHAAEGDVKLAGDLVGSSNTINALEDAEGNGGNISVAGTIDGDSNILTAYESITTGNIEGDKNDLAAGTSIVTKDIVGDENVLNAGTSITTDNIDGDKNVLDAGTTIETGDIAGNQNDLDAVDDITTGTITGNSNTLDSVKGDIKTGSIDGTNNSLVADGGKVYIDGNLAGSDNIVHVKETIIVKDKVSGTGHVLTSLGTANSEDIAIQIGEFAAEGTKLIIPESEGSTEKGSIAIDKMSSTGGKADATLKNVIKTPSGNVIIGELADANAYTEITTSDKNSIFVGSPITTLAAADYDNPNTASNQTWNTGIVNITSPNGLQLTDSVITADSITGTSLVLTTSGTTKFTSTADNVTLDNLELYEHAALAVNGVVDVNNLTLQGGNAVLTYNTLDVSDTLTLIDGARITGQSLDVKTLKVVNASFDTTYFNGAENLELIGSTANFNTDLAITGNLTLKAVVLDEDGKAARDANENYITDISGAESSRKSSLDAKNLSVGGNLNAQDSSISISNYVTVTGTVELKDAALKGGEITVKGDVQDGEYAIKVNGGSLTTTTGKLTGEGLSATGTTITAATGIDLKSGDLSAAGGSTIKGAITGAADAAVNGSTVEGTIGMSGELTVTDGTITGKVSGASAATITGDKKDTTVADIEFDSTNGGALTVTDAKVGNVTYATNATIIGEDKDTSVGNIAMKGDLTATNATIGNVTGATSATLSQVKGGSLTIIEPVKTKMLRSIPAAASGSRDVVLTDGSELLSISGANDVTIDSSKVTTTVGMDGMLTVTNGEIAGGLVAGTTVTGADITNATIGSGITATGEVGIDGKSTITGAVEGTTVTIDDSTTGAVTANTGDATITGSSTINGAVTAKQGTASVTGGSTGTIDANAVITDGTKVDGDVLSATTADLTNGSVSGKVEASGAATIAGTNITGAVKGSSVTMNKGMAASVEATSTDVQLTDATIAGTVTANGNVTMTGGTATDVTATTGNATITGADSVGTVTATSGLATIETSKAATVNANEVKLTDATITGSDTVENDVNATTSVVITGASSIAGNVNAGTSVDMTGGSVAGNVNAGTQATLSAATITGNVKGTAVTMTGGSAADVTATTGDATITKATVDSVTAEGNVTLTNATINGDDDASTVDVSAKGLATITSGEIDGDVTAAQVNMIGTSYVGDIVATGANANLVVGENGGTVNAAVFVSGVGSAASITAENGGVVVTGSTTGAITGEDFVHVADGTVQGNVTVKDEDTNGTSTAYIDDASISGDVTAEQVTMIDGSAASVTATDGDVTLTNATINGDGKADTVDVSATGKATITGGSIAGDVQAATVTMTGGNAEDVTATTGDVTITNATVDSVKAENGLVSVTGTIVDGVTVGQVTGSVKGNSVALKDAKVGGDVTSSDSAQISGTEIGGNVKAGSLNLTGGSSVAGTAAITGDTIIGESDITGLLTVTGGKLEATNATIGGIDGTATEAKLTDVTVADKDGNAADVTVAGDLTMTEGSSAKNVEAGSVAATDATITGNVEATTGAVELTTSTVGGNVSADTTVTTDDTTITGTVTGTAVSMEDGSAKQVTATDGDVTLTDVTITGDGDDTTADVTASGKATINGGSVGGDVTAAQVVIAGTTENGVTTSVQDITATGADATIELASGESVTAAVIATNTKVNGSITAEQGGIYADAAIITGDVSAEGAVTASDGSIGGDITNATDVTLTNNDVTGTNGITMTGALSMTNSDAAKVTGAISAELDKATITGALSMTGNDADVKAENGSSIGSISGANDVTLTKSDVTGTDGISMSGALTMTEASAAKVTGATSATLTDATISGELNVTGGIIEATDATIGSITGTAISATLEGVTVGKDGVAGDIEVAGSVEMIGSTGGNITGATSVTLSDKVVDAADGSQVVTDTKVTGSITMSDALVMNGAEVTENITGATSATLTDATITGDLAMTNNADDNDVTAIGGSIGGDITGADAVSLDGTKVTGNIGTTDAKVTDVTLTNGATASAISMSGALEMTEGASAASVTGAKGAEVTDSTVTGELNVVSGDLVASNATIGSITGAAESAELKNTHVGTKAADGTIATYGDVTVAGALTMTEGSSAEDVTAGSVAATDATITGNVSATTGAVELTTSTVGGNVSATDVTLTNSAVTGSITMDGALSMTEGSSAGSVTGAKGAEVTDSTVTGELNVVSGDLVATNATIGSITGAATSAELTNVTVNGNVTTAGSVTLDNTSINGGQGTVSMAGALDMKNGATAGNITGATNATLDGAGTKAGDIAMNGELTVTNGATAGDITGATNATLDGAGTKAGAIVDMNGDLTVTNGATAGKITGTVNNATLSNGATIVSDLTVVGLTAVEGNVTVKGDVQTEDLSVTNGTLTAADGTTLYDVTVDGTTTLTNGKVVAGVFTSDEIKLIDMAGEVTQLVSNASVDMDGTILTVTGDMDNSVDVAGDLTLRADELGHIATLTTQGGVDVDGTITVEGGSKLTAEKTVDGEDGVTVSGTDSIIVAKNGVTSTGAVSVTDGAKIDGAVTGSASVEVTSGSITGDVTSTGAVTVNSGEIGGSVKESASVSVAYGDITGSVKTTGAVTLKNGTAGAITMGGALSMTEHSSAASVTGATGAEVTNSTVTGELNVVSGALVASNATIGSITGAAESAELKNTHVGTKAEDGTIDTYGDVTVAGALTMTEGSSANNVEAGSVKADDSTIKGNVTATGDVTLDDTDVEGTTGITMGGALSMTNSDAAAVTGATSATLKDATITGELAVTGGAINAEDATIGFISGTASSTKLTDVTVGDIEVAGSVEMIGSTGGNITGATNVTLTGDEDTVTTVGTVDMNGELSMTNATADSVTDATSATLDKATISGALTMTGNDADVKAENGSSIGSISGANDVTLTKSDVTGTDGITMNGALSMTEASAAKVTGATSAELTDATISGDLTMAATGSDRNVSVTDGAITGTISNADKVTLKDATVGSITGKIDVVLENSKTTDSVVMVNSGLDVKSLDVTGNVTVAGDINSDTLAVTNGTLTAKDDQGLCDVTVTGKTTLANGTVEAAVFTSGEVELVDMGGSVEELISGDSVTMQGTQLTVTSTKDASVDVAKDLTLTTDAEGDIATLTTNGGVDVEGTITVEGGSKLTAVGTVDGKDGVTVSGTGSIIAANVTSTGAVTVTDGTIDGAVTGSASVAVTDGSITGGVTSTGTVTVTDGSIGGAVSGTDVTVNGGKIAGAVTGSSSVAVTDGSITGAVTSTGAVTVTDGSIGGAVSGTDVTVIAKDDQASVGDVTMNGALKVDGGTTGAVTGTVTGATLSNGASIGSGLTVTGTTDVTNGATVKGDLTTDDLTVAGGTLTVDGTVTDNSTDGLTLTGSTTKVDADAVKTTGGLSVQNGAIVDAAVTGSASVEVTTGGTITGAVTTTGAVSVNGNNSTISGDVTGATTVDVTDKGVISGSIVDATGAVTVTDGSVQGSVDTEGAVTVTNGSVGSIADAADVTVTNGTVGSISGAENVTVSGANAVVGDVAMNGNLTVEEGAQTGKITGTVGNATLTNDAIIGMGGDTLTVGSMTTTGDVTVQGGVTAGSLTVNDGTLHANSADGTTKYDVYVTGEAVLNGGSVAAGKFSADGGIKISGTDVTIDELDSKGDTSLSGGSTTVKGDATVEGNLGMSGAGELEVLGDVTTDSVSVKEGYQFIADSLDLSLESLTSDDLEYGLTVEGTSKDSGLASTVDVKGTINAADKGVSVTDGGIVKAGDGITNAGAVNVDGGKILADVTDATTLDVINGEIDGDVTASKDTTLDNATITGKLDVDGTTTVDSASTVGSADLAGLTVEKGATLTSTTGDLSAKGAVELEGALMSTKGSIALTGDKGSTIDADVTAAKDVTLAGEFEAADVTISAGEMVTLDGTLGAEKVTIDGEDIVITGTLNAGEKVTLDGTVTGSGTIVKTGGDTLELADDTNIGAVKVDDKSTLAAAGIIGKLNMADGTTLQVAGEENIGTLTVNGGKLDAGTTVEVDLNLTPNARAAQQLHDIIEGKLDLANAKLELIDEETDESLVAVGGNDRYTIAKGATGSFHEDVDHGYETLNVHAEGGDIVFSKNYKGAADKTENQAATADALASIDVESLPDGSELDKVMDALAHTRSEADAKAALDSLSGAGITGLQKAITDETKEHLQTLRSTMKALSADVNRRFDASGQPIEGVQSSAISASVTGGNSELNGDDNCGDYSRNSFGGMVAMAHALYNGWTFGASFAFSYADAECGDVSMEGDFIYIDLAMMHKGARLTQTGTIGAAFINFDTERDVLVNAAGHSYSGTAEGSTSAVAINMSYEMAYDLIKSDDGHRFGSVVMAEATFAQIDGMEEEGMGNAGVRSEFDDVASFTFGVGARYTYEYGSVLNPGFFSLEAMVVAEAGDNTPKVNNMFIGGGQTYELVGPEAGEIGLRLNANWLLPIGEQTGFFMNVTSEFRADQTEVGGSAGVKYSF